MVDLSFSGNVKTELLEIIPPAKHCRIAELAALFSCLGTVEEVTGRGKKGRFYAVRLAPENPELLKKVFTLISNTTIIKERFLLNSEQFTAAADISDADDPWGQFLGMIKAVNEDGTVRSPEEGVSRILLKRDCCRRAYLRGMFLAAGSMSDPSREYHLEFVCAHEGVADQIRSVLGEEGFGARIVRRKKHFVVYLKDSTEIVDFLGLTGAHSALLQMENSRILKEIANTVNRQVNCETSNLMKTVRASERQIEDIEYIETHGGLGQLPDGLRRMAEARLEHRDSALGELGTFLEPPVGKSGVNHRLRRISEIADRLRLREQDPAET